ncbi:XdhC family protein [Planotetraspora phitsanulokensis]|uniref:Xanthine dehydrogenase accessory factor n=1 Tax=Planotetraspora phitsanulokensis TaxID=575192 RepID=A0A8J3UEG0_9ACTN|nr:XdhC family protein [Planotetraspora phitsanulokensis]GII40859.1 xanthine dehydrogenase accessory factor [Planotetraspora phitsanulokensis]
MAHSDTHVHEADPACAVAHGETAPPQDDRTLVAVFASPVAGYLLRYGADLGYRGILLEPDRDLAEKVRAEAPAFEVTSGPPAGLDGTADVVVTDHHRADLGPVLRDLLAHECRWIGVMGKPYHPAPHEVALAELGVPAEVVARVHRPIGLNIGSRTPPEIAVATLAGLVADRNGRPGGFAF